MNETETLKWKIVNKMHCITMVKKKQANYSRKDLYNETLHLEKTLGRKTGGQKFGNSLHIYTVCDSDGLSSFQHTTVRAPKALVLILDIVE